MHVPLFGKVAGQDVVHMLLTILIPPSLFYYEVFLVLPSMDAHIFHTFVAAFLLHNVVGNALQGRVRSFLNRIPKLSPADAGPPPDWRHCETCIAPAPARSWHCDVCEMCILKRDHHCNFFGVCVGYFNHRYFSMFVLYVFVSTVYASYFNIMFMIYHFRWDLMSWLSYTKFIFPLAAIAIDASEESFHLFFVIICVVVAIFSGYLLFYHGRVVLKGQITPEWKHGERESYSGGWKRNLKEVFGTQWYFSLLSPWLSSPLPGDGVHWGVNAMDKGE